MKVRLYVDKQRISTSKLYIEKFYYLINKTEAYLSLNGGYDCKDWDLWFDSCCWYSYFLKSRSEILNDDDLWDKATYIEEEEAFLSRYYNCPYAIEYGDSYEKESLCIKDANGETVKDLMNVDLTDCFEDIEHLPTHVAINNLIEIIKQATMYELEELYQEETY